MCGVLTVKVTKETPIPFKLSVFCNPKLAKGLTLATVRTMSNRSH